MAKVLVNRLSPATSGRNWFRGWCQRGIGHAFTRKGDKATFSGRGRSRPRRSDQQGQSPRRPQRCVAHVSSGAWHARARAARGQRHRRRQGGRARAHRQALGRRRAGARATDIGRWHRAGEERIEASGLPYVFLRPASFDANAFWWAGSIKAQNTVYGALGEAALPVVDPGDVAEAAAAVLRRRGMPARPTTSPDRPR